ncbi:MAG: Uma2 family endonuclease [Cytophagales bacterium]|nr:Uma2 family endonuclease [Bernardetiaceae bacterium]MDW8210999.1 Uma2 family endonuclease [Cytophagales bacterium]
MVTSLLELDFGKQYTYADYLTWKFVERVELLKGFIRQMSAPSVRHQRISVRLSGMLSSFFRKTPCEVFHAPFDVRLYDRQKSYLSDEQIYTVVQPDLCVICDASKLDERGCNGAPDWIIEILSPGNPQTDLRDKYELYQEAGVLEYWIVFPSEQIVEQFVLKEGSYYLHEVYHAEATAVPVLFPALSIPLQEVFAK